MIRVFHLLKKIDKKILCTKVFLNKFELKQKKMDNKVNYLIHKIHQNNVKTFRFRLHCYMDFVILPKTIKLLPITKLVRFWVVLLRVFSPKHIQHILSIFRKYFYIKRKKYFRFFMIWYKLYKYIFLFYINVLPEYFENMSLKRAFDINPNVTAKFVEKVLL